MPDSSPYSLSFTAASLRPELIRVIAATYLELGDWRRTKAQVLADNALQSRSPSSAIRIEIELRHRLMRLTQPQLELAAKGMINERVAIAWLAATKGSQYIFSFAADLLRTKIAQIDPIVRPSDYEAFVSNQSAAHPAVAKITPSTKAKIRSGLFTMVCEAGIGERNGDELRITRPYIPPAVQSVISSDSPIWFSGFLVPDEELSSF